MKAPFTVPFRRSAIRGRYDGLQMQLGTPALIEVWND